jgi:hypothetical protein
MRRRPATVDTMPTPRASLRPEPTRPAKLLNRVLAPLGSRFPDVSFETFARVAERITRLDDWGDDAAIARFRRCAEALQANDNLSPWGRIALRIYLQSKFVNHLKRVAFVRRHPEVREVPIEAPIVILGWYRTGTTLLHNLLTADLRHRAPRTWEVWFPVPFARDPRHDRRLRRAATAFLLGTNRFVVPEQAQAHYIEVDYPEECFFLLENAGCSTTLFNTCQAYDYGLSLLDEDLGPVYADHKLQLQILSLAQPRKRWVLKCPFHLWALDALLATYPDALCVQTHRDVRKALPSNCSLSAMTTSKFVTQLDLRAHGAFWEKFYALGMERGLASRQRIPDGRIADLRLTDLSRAPVPTIRALYEDLGLDFPLGVETAYRHEALQHPKDAHGAHVYSLEEFGLDAGRLAERFADYHAAFLTDDPPAAERRAGGHR